MSPFCFRCGFVIPACICPAGPTPAPGGHAFGIGPMAAPAPNAPVDDADLAVQLEILLRSYEEDLAAANVDEKDDRVRHARAFVEWLTKRSV